MVRGEGEDRGRGHCRLQGFEGTLLCGTPGPDLRFLGEGMEGAGNVGETFDESLVEVDKS